MDDWETSLRKFESAVDAAVIAFPAQIHVIQRTLALKALVKIVFRTPVDTGRARGNWQVSYETGEGKAPLPTMDKNGGATLQALTAKVNATPEWSGVYLHNNLVYIVRLEEGWSKKQAPNGMIRPTLIELTDELR